MVSRRALASLRRKDLKAEVSGNDRTGSPFPAIDSAAEPFAVP